GGNSGSDLRRGGYRRAAPAPQSSHATSASGVPCRTALHGLSLVPPGGRELQGVQHPKASRRALDQLAEPGVQRAPASLIVPIEDFIAHDFFLSHLNFELTRHGKTAALPFWGPCPPW